MELVLYQDKIVSVFSQMLNIWASRTQGQETISQMWV